MNLIMFQFLSEFLSVYLSISFFSPRIVDNALHDILFSFVSTTQPTLLCFTLLYLPSCYLILPLFLLSSPQFYSLLFSSPLISHISSLILTSLFFSSRLLPSPFSISPLFFPSLLSSILVLSLLVLSSSLLLSFLLLLFYSGDWLVTLSWCLLCGYKSPVPYFQAIYFLVLLIHRYVRSYLYIMR